MTDLVPTDDVPDDEGALFVYVAGLVERGRRVASAQANAALTVTYWLIGHAISVNLLRQQRADYGKKTVATLSRELTARFGRGFELASLRRMVQFAEEFPDFDIVATVSRQLSWSHLKELLPLRSDEARKFYIEQTTMKNLAVRELPARPSPARPGNGARSPTVRSPKARRSHATRSLIRCSSTCWACTTAIWRGQSSLCRGRHNVDLLFFSRPLRRLVAVELKLGALQPAHVG